ncbi:MAG: hypothetical protein HZB39_17130 [Planctomycetes bacterium]|nr:hypothetical protein [Planctomycetota bacterium]
MLAILAACVVSAIGPQSLEPRPAVAERGETVQVTVRDAGERPLAGVDVDLVESAPDGKARRRSLGASDAQGTLSFVAEAAGGFALRARVAGVDLVAPLVVAERRSRVWSATLGVAASLGILWALSRRARARRAA